MTSIARQILSIIQQQEKDQERFARTAAERVTKMGLALAELLGEPAKVDLLQMTGIEGEEVLKAFDGTLVSRKGCHFGLLIKIGTWEIRELSSIFPKGDRFMVRIDAVDDNAIDVTEDAGVQAWAKWAVNTSIPSKFADTISGVLTAQMKKPS